MPIQKKIYEPDLQTDRAKDVKGEVIFIDNALSGRKGYFCLGCDKPMQANIQRKNPNHRSYFSHIPVDLSKGEKKCTYSNREQRELIATDILQRIKRIKVPGVLKFPPKGTEGNPVELSQPKFIEAHKVRSQLTFYEDEEGNIHNGKNPDIEDRYLLLRPDVTFFNEKGESILFIELVDTHKVSDEKKIKLRRLGIDTVSIIIPRASDQEIEDNFKSIQRVKWEYNDKEARTSYVSVSDRAPKGVLEFDEQQRRIFGESVPCRKSRINNTIRSLTKCLGRESYKNAERDFKREIFRVKSAAEGVRERLAELEKRYDAEVFSNFKKEFEGIQQRQEELRTKNNKFRSKRSNVEGRYNTKREEISEATRKILENGGTEEYLREVFKQKSDKLREEFDAISADWKRTIADRRESIQTISRRREELPIRIGEQEREIDKKLIEQFRVEEESLSRDIRREERIIHTIRQQERTVSEEFRKLEERERANFREQEKGITNQEESLERTIHTELLEELEKPSSGLPREVGFILQAQRVGRDYKDAEREEERYKRAREFFKKGTWKTR